MENRFDPNEIIPNSPLAEILGIFQAGRIPDELLPETPEDRAAISALQTAIWPITQTLVSSNAQMLERRLPLEDLCHLLALEILPFIRRAHRNAVANQPDVRRDHRSELRALSSFIHFEL